MLLGSHTHDEFMDLATTFHGYPAPGIIIGAYMTEFAKEHVKPMLDDHGLYNAISETGQCLPDAIQMLTPCTVGNSWLKICDNGRYAMSLFNKYNGAGVRVYLDINKLDAYPTIKEWLMKLRPKREQNTALLQEEIRQAKTAILSVQEIQAKDEFFGKHGKGGIATCALCGEPIPSRNGLICDACNGNTPYVSVDEEAPKLRSVPLEDAIGRKALHDMTRIAPKEFKGVQVKAGQVISIGDMCDLQRIGKNNIYLADDSDDIADSATIDNPNMASTNTLSNTNSSTNLERSAYHNVAYTSTSSQAMHENDCAARMACLLGGKNVKAVDQIREGKISFVAQNDGLLWLDEKRLTDFNRLGSMVAVTRKQATLVKKGEIVASARAIPLYITKQQWLRGENILRKAPLFSVLPLSATKVGILITGSEVFNGIIEDRFEPIIKEKLEQYPCELVETVIVADDKEEITRKVNALRDKGVNLIITTAGLSVDPDDVTRKALLDAGLENILYGMPILPGSMSLVGDFPASQDKAFCKVIGVPACALFHKVTAFDMLLPLTLSNAPVDREFFALRSNGGLCENCKTCTYPKCRFAV